MVITMLEEFIDERAAHGQSYFDREEALGAAGLKPASLSAAITRMIKRRRVANPRHGFYLILRPEDRVMGAPDPVRWIDFLMKHQGLDYRISLLRAAAFHGASHQAAMVFQVIAPRQLRGIRLGRQRVEFLYQSPGIFARVNQAGLLDEIKSDTGYARIAGVELTLLDCTRYMRDAGGIHGVAQIVKDVGAKAGSRKLREAAACYESACVRRLGYLLEKAGHMRQAGALEAYARKAEAEAPLVPAIKHKVSSFNEGWKKDARWKLEINETVEVDF